MLIAYKYRIYPTDEQKILFAKTFGCCRYVYNWALNKKIEAYKADKSSLSCFSLMKDMTSLKKDLEWLKEVNSQSLQSALRNLDTAYQNFFRNVHAVGFPKFKSKRDKQSFLCPQNCSADFSHGFLNIPKAKNIPAIFHRKFRGLIKTVTITMNPSGKYFASILVDDAKRTEIPVREVSKDTTIGIDLGIKSLAVCSDGREFQNNKYLKKSLARLAFLQKSLSRKKKESSNRNKARLKVAKLQESIANKRKDVLHKITYALTHDNQVRTICIEDLNVKGMTKNHHLAQSINDASFGQFREILEYKCKWYGINLVKIDRFAPSSKTCSCCGAIYRNLKLSERSWTCHQCGAHHDRDLNAAINIKEFGLKALSSERGEVKSVETPTMDDRALHLKSSVSAKQKK